MKRSRTVKNAVIIAVFTAFCAVVLEFFAVNIGQPAPFASEYTVHAVFSDADGVPNSADVRVAGVDVGRVVDVSHDPSAPGETVVTLQITDPTAVPLYTNGSAIVKPKTLLGEKFVDLTVGNPNTAEAINDGGYLPPAQTGKTVSNDEINNAVAPTVAAQQQAINELGPALQSQNNVLNLIVAPQAACGGNPCGIDQVFTGTLLGNINYPNDQLTVSTSAGELVTDEWDALFSQPRNDHRPL